MVNNGKIEGISDIRDESDRDGMRIVIELKKDEQTSSNQIYTKKRHCSLILSNIFSSSEWKAYSIKFKTISN